MAVDPSGAVHVVGVEDGDVAYLTNAGGRWSVDYPAVPVGVGPADDVAALAVDGSGRIAVAYERSDCRAGGCMERGGEMRVALIRPSDQSPRLVNLGDGLQPSVALHGGVVHVGWLAGRWSDDGGGCPRPAMYATNASGAWTVTELAPDAANGAFISTHEDGTPVLAIANGCDYLPEPAYIVTFAPDGSPQLDPIPGLVWGGWVTGFATGPNYQTHLVYDDGEGQNLYLVGTHAAWTPPIPLSEGHSARSLAVDQLGAAHVTMTGDQGIWYTSNTTGAFVEEQIMTDPVSDYWGTAVMAVDSLATPHILFAVANTRGAPSELWYATRTTEP